MGVEIERKFLVKGRPWEGVEGIPMAQAYLSRDPDRIVRIRLAGDRAWITIKGQSHGPARPEFEYAIPPDDARQILENLALPGRIEKIRYRLPYARHLWEIDVFTGALTGLVIAEVELNSTEEPVHLPPWIGQEVTDDPAYSNSALSAKISVGSGAD
ncbi:MAG: CYTH domain-containing protein [Candidatus Methylacidiphilales bacterium]